MGSPGVVFVSIGVLAAFVSACADAPPAGPPTGVGATAEVITVARLTCEPDGSTTLDDSQVAARPDGVHVSAAMQALSGLLPDDRVIESRSGYPEADRPPSIVVLRDGTPIVKVQVFQGANELWLVGGADGCDGYGVDVG